MLKLTVHKAEGTGRGNGWYFLVNGTKEDRTLTDVGAEDWYSSQKEATRAGKNFLQNCTYNPQYGWVIAH